MPLATVTCEYDGTVLTLTPEGLEPACPTCAEDLAAHAAGCYGCRTSPNLPERGGLNLNALA